MSPWQVDNLAAIAARLGAVRASNPGVLFEAQTAHQHVVVRKRRSQLLLCYRHPDTGFEEVQSRLDPARPLELLSAYTQAMLLGLVWCPAPRRMLFIGLGGARMQLLLHHRFEAARLDTVEIDPVVVRLAEDYFGFRSDARQRVWTMDGRAYLRRPAGSVAYDLIFLDAYQAHGVPAHLATYEFYTECRKRLCPRGVVVVNLHSSIPAYAAARRTFSAAFPHTLACSVASGNVVAIGSADDTLNPRALRSPTCAASALPAGGPSLSDWARRVSLRAPYRETAPILYDRGPSVAE